MALALTAYGVAQGYTLSTLISGFTPNGGNIGPLGVAFPASGAAMLLSALGASNNFVYSSASTADNQTVGGLTAAQTLATSTTPRFLVAVGSRVFLSENATIIELNTDGTVKQTVVTAGGTVYGLAVDPTNTYLYAAVAGTGIVRYLISNWAATTLTTDGADGIALSPDGTILYTSNLKGYSTVPATLGNIVWTYSGTALTSPDGVAAYGTVLIVNDNNGSVYEIALAGGNAQAIANGGSRGDFVSQYPGGSLLLTQSDRVSHLYVPVSPPTGVVAVAGCAQVSLSWNAALGALSYNVYRATVSGGPYTYLGNTAGLTWTDNVPVPGQTYYYVVKTVGDLTSGNSAEASATTPLPAQVQNVATVPGDHQVTLTWNAVSPVLGNAIVYDIYRGTVHTDAEATFPATPGTIAPPGVGTLADTLLVSGVAALNYTDLTAKNGTVYYYRVLARCTCGSGAKSTESSARPVCCTPNYQSGPAAPGTCLSAPLLPGSYTAADCP